MLWTLKKNHSVFDEEFIILLRNRGELKGRLIANSKDPIYWSTLEVSSRADKKYNDSDHYSWKISNID